MKRQYPVTYEWAGKNFSGFAPDLPGCIATARTLAKIRINLKDALEAHLQWMKDDGDPIPEPSAVVTVNMAEDPQFPTPPGYYVVIESLELTLPKKRRTFTRKTAMRELTAA